MEIDVRHSLACILLYVQMSVDSKVNRISYNI